MMEIPLPRPDLVQPADFTGRFSFYDDGWPGVLVLSEVSGFDLCGTYHSYRLNADYVATALVDERQRHHLAITIHDFNGMDRQLFDGYLFTSRKNVITGETSWKTIPYSFVARRCAPWTLSTFRPGGLAEPGDFAGWYSVYYDGGQGTVYLESVEGRSLRGVWRALGNRTELPVTATVDAEVPIRVTLRIDHGLNDGVQPPIMTGLLFSRPKNLVAGWIDWRGERLGCYMVRYR